MDAPSHCVWINSDGKACANPRILKANVNIFFCSNKSSKRLFSLKKYCSKDGCQGRNKLCRTSKKALQIRKRLFCGFFIATFDWPEPEESPPPPPSSPSRENKDESCLYNRIIFHSLLRQITVCTLNRTKTKNRKWQFSGFTPSFPSFFPIRTVLNLTDKKH